MRFDDCALLARMGRGSGDDDALSGGVHERRELCGIDRERRHVELQVPGGRDPRRAQCPEPFGIVVIEAMCLGKTVLASALGGPLEIVVPGSGLLFDPARPADVAQLLSRASSDGELRAELGRGARVRADVFSVRALLEGTQAAYDAVLRRRRGAAPTAQGAAD